MELRPKQTLVMIAPTAGGKTITLRQLVDEDLSADNSVLVFDYDGSWEPIPGVSIVHIEPGTDLVDLMERIELGVDVIVIDALYSGWEQAAADVEYLQRFAQKYDCAIVVAVQSPKVPDDEPLVARVAGVDPQPCYFKGQDEA